MKRPELFSERFRWLADRVRDGHRETPQRFHPLAWRILRAPESRSLILSLCSWVLRYLAAEFREDRSRPAPIADLVERGRVLVEERLTAEGIEALGSDVLALAPVRFRRRHVHCHGRVVSDRALLVLRSMLPVLESVTRPGHASPAKAGTLAFELAALTAYFVADYDDDHFVFTGSDVADRFVLMALWSQGNMQGDGLRFAVGRVANVKE